MVETPNNLTIQRLNINNYWHTVKWWVDFFANFFSDSDTIFMLSWLDKDECLFILIEIKLRV